MGSDLVGVLRVEVEVLAAQAAIRVASALQEDHGRAAEEAGESVGERNRREHEKAIGGDAKEHIDGVVSVAAAEFHLVAAADPGDRAGKIDRVFVRVARASDGIACRSVTADLQERGADGGVERRSVVEAEAGGRSVIDGLVEEEFVAEEREAQDADERG